MKKLRSIIVPPLLGLLVYACLRLVSDVPMGYRFWERTWQVNAAEIGGTILISYALVAILRRMVSRFNEKAIHSLSADVVVIELFQILGVVFLFLNCTATVLAALTDDGLSVADVVIINIVPVAFILVYYLFARANYFWKSFASQRIAMEELQKDKLETELKFLRAQYHPHFLFNALNTVYFQMDEDVPAAKKTIETFSSLLRYQLYDQSKTVLAAQEISYLLDYIEMQQIRMPESITWNKDVIKDAGTAKVYPLLLLPLVENACKYVSRPGSIGLHIYMEEKALCCRVINTFDHTNEKKIMGGGIGLQNLQRRLELLYPGAYQFHSGPTEDGWEAFLKVPLLFD